MRRLVLARAAVAAVTVAGITAGLAPVTTAVAAEAPEPGLTIPAAVEGDPTAAVLQQAGETGYLTGTVKTGFHWTSYADKATEPVPVPAGYTTVYGTDSDVLAFVGDGRSVLLRDMRDGGERTFPVPAGESLRLVIGDAVVTEADGPKPTRWTVHTWQDGRISSRTVPVAGADSTGLLAWDRDGFYLTTTYGTLLDDWRYTDIHRVDVSGTTTRTRLADLPYDTASNGDTVSQWHEDGRLTVWNRKTTDLQKPVRELTVPYDKRASLLGTVGDHALIARPLSAKEVTPYADLMWRVVAVPFDGGPERTLFERATAMPRYKADGTLLVGAATARGTGGETGPGVYTVRPGADGGLVTGKLVDAPPARGSVAGLSLAQGRLTTVDRVPLLDGPEALLRSTDLKVAGTPRAGVRTERGADAAQFPGGCLTAADCPETFATGDGRVVFRTKDGKGLGVIDAGGSLPARTVTTEQPIAASPDSLRVSGRYAAARSTDDRLRVYDVETGKNVRTETGGTPFALSGSTLWKQQGGTAEVRAVDVSTGRSAGTAALPADCRTPGLQAAGTFLYWRCATGESAVYDTASRTSVPLPAHTAALLSDGYVAWLKDGQLHTTDVRGTAGTRLIGTPKGGAPGRDWTVDRFGGPVAYVDADEAVRVVPAGAEAPGLAAPDADVPPTAPGSWKPRWWVSKPAASWALTLTHKATGTVVRTLTGGEARGVVAADWDGKDADGKSVTNGAYTWTMTAEPADGDGPRLERRGALLVSGGLASAYGTYKPVTPTRLMDTRSGLGVPKAKVGPAGTVTLRVAGVGGVPATGVTAVVLNVTATGPTSAGFVSVYPSGAQRTSASNLNFTAGQTVPNLVVVPVVDGKVSFYNHAGSVDLLADVAGYSTGDGTGSTYEPVTPTRLMDTRSGLGVPKAKVGPGGTVTLPIARPGVSAVVLNVTATGPTSAGFVSVYPSGTQRTSASNLNFTAGQTVPNLVVVPVVDGKVSFYNHAGSVDLLADVAGYYLPGGAGSEYRPVTPTRLMDTRSGLGVPQEPVGPGRTVTLAITEPGVSAVVLNVTATGATATSYVSVHPSGTPRTSATNLNFTAGQTVPNLVVVPVVDGKVSFYNHAGSVNLIADVAGYYAG